MDEGAVTELRQADAAEGLLRDLAKSPLQAELSKFRRSSESQLRNLRWSPLVGLSGYGGLKVIGVIRALINGDNFKLNMNLMELGLILVVGLGFALVLFYSQRTLAGKWPDMQAEVRKAIDSNNLFSKVLDKVEGNEREGPQTIVQRFEFLRLFGNRPQGRSREIVLALTKQGTALLRKHFNVDRHSIFVMMVLEAKLRVALAEVLEEELGAVEPPER